jgi:hypothetical protein
LLENLLNDELNMIIDIINYELNMTTDINVSFSVFILYITYNIFFWCYDSIYIIIDLVLIHTLFKCWPLTSVLQRCSSKLHRLILTHWTSILMHDCIHINTKYILHILHSLWPWLSFNIAMNWKQSLTQLEDWVIFNGRNTFSLNWTLSCSNALMCQTSSPTDTMSQWL